MKYRYWGLAIGGVSVLLIEAAAAQSAASCRKAEFRNGSPVFYNDRACMARIKAKARKAKRRRNTVRKKVNKNVAKKSQAQRAKSKRRATVRRKVRSNPRLKQVQRLLAKKGAYSGKATGVMDKSTRRAIMAYYKKNNLDRGNGTTLDAVRNSLRGKPTRKRIVAAPAMKRPAVSAPATAKVALPKVAVPSMPKVAVPAAPKVAAKPSLYQRLKNKVVGGGAPAPAVSAQGDNELAKASAAAAAKRAARVAKIKAAVAAKKAAAAKAKANVSTPAPKVAAKPSLFQRLKNKVVGVTPSMPKVAAPSASVGTDNALAKASAAAAAKRAARVAKIKAAVAAKKAAKAKAASKPASVAKADNALAKASAAAAAKRAARVAKIKAAVAAKKAAAKAKSGSKPVAVAKSDNALAKASAAAAAKRAARVAKIKAAVAAKKAAAAKKTIAVAALTPKATLPSSTPAKGGAGNVAELQTLLKAKGLYSGAIDGQMNIGTRKSVIKYYNANNVDIGNGTIAQGVHKHLKSSSGSVAAAKATAPVSKGDASIADLQTRLKGKGLYSGAIDGQMNIDTRKSVIKYYNAHNVDIGSGTIAQGVHKHLKSAAPTAASAPAAPKSAAPAKSARASGGNEVEGIQKMLAQKGLYKGPADGMLTPTTRKAILQYYKANKISRGKQTILNVVHQHLQTNAS